ncbi:MAG: HNH endonuclease signature motif containing protein [Dehalococcoidia bacterium]|jgi:ribosomal protein S27AE
MRTSNKLWTPDNKESNKHPEWSRGSDVKVYDGQGNLKEIIPIKLYRKSPKKAKPQAKPYNARDNPKYKKWRDDILRRDKRKCVLCGSSAFPNVHHVERWADNPRLRYNIDNGVTVCMVCHNRHHGPHRQPFPQNISDILIAYLGRFNARPVDK